MNPQYPHDAICDVETCGHLNSEHNLNCGACLVNKGRGHTVEDPSHEFRPKIRGGRVVTPGFEKSAYDQAMKGQDPDLIAETVLPEDGLFA